MKWEQQLLKYILTIAGTFVLPWEIAQARSQLKLNQGAFFTEWIDIKIGDWRLVRQYHSRSLFNGVFGIGWCSSLDYRVIVKGDDTKLQTCFNENIANSKIQKDLNGEYFWNESDSTQWRFDSDGHLKTVTQNKFTIHFEKNRNGTISRIFDGKLSYRLRYDNNNLITAVGPANFKYDNQLQLISFTNQWKSKFNLEYNFYGNLIKINGPHNYLETIEYDDELDVVIKWQDRKGCISNTLWKASEINQSLATLTSETKKECLL